ncbi:MAG TPA: L-asparaginase [Sulfurospirillum sp. UBA12182]|jgi:L-asparaginase II|nr:MAG TPA: L-asparaginase [Sulfurospirillum sp. UBA12182]
MSIVAKVYRGSIVDLTHIGHVAVTDTKGNILHSVGNPKRVTYIRSSAKPIQALVALESGAVDAYGLTQKELAIFCASHNGELEHTNTIEGILKKAGLGVEFLQCGTHPSLNPNVAKELEAEGVVLNNANNNCSGKHSGMLLGTKYLGEDLQTYLNINHPVQQRILNAISEICEYPKEEIVIGTDGCGVPVHALPLFKYAQGIAKLSKPEVFDELRAKNVTRVIDAMVTYPYMVAGRDRVCTDLMEVCKGRIFAKLGADGYYAMGIRNEGIGITCKIEDGKIPIVEALAVHVLYKLGFISKTEFNALERYHKIEVKNHRGEIVGRTEFDFQI